MGREKLAPSPEPLREKRLRSVVGIARPRASEVSAPHQARAGQRLRPQQHVRCHQCERGVRACLDRAASRVSTALRCVAAMLACLALLGIAPGSRALSAMRIPRRGPELTFYFGLKRPEAKAVGALWAG